MRHRSYIVLRHQLKLNEFKTRKKMTTFKFIQTIKTKWKSPNAIFGKSIAVIYRTCVLLPLVFLSLNSPVSAQERMLPTWWFGIAGAANINFYRGTAQILNDNLT